MKVKIWIELKHALAGRVYPGMHYELFRAPNLVEVMISSDEFAQLSDDKDNKKFVEEFWDDEDDDDREQDWLVEQYNRNRPQKDWIQDADEMDQNNQPFGD